MSEKHNTSDPDDDRSKRPRTEEDVDNPTAAVDVPPVACTASSELTPGVPASPPSFVTMEELMQVADGVTNMALAHEIAVNDQFKLQPREVPENSLEGRVKEVVHQAFWDHMRESLQQDPPDYSRAIGRIVEMKQMLLTLLLPWQSRIKTEIEEKLDEAVMSQQADAGTIVLSDYTDYVLGVMARFCAPERDEAVREAGRHTDTVSLLKAILETLALMKVDMANFSVQAIRPYMAANGIEYERRKLNEYLRKTGNTLPLTRAWLSRSLVADVARTDRIRSTVNAAYLELLQWDRWGRSGKTVKEEVPETVSMDWGRLVDISCRCHRVAALAAAVLVTCGSACGQLLQSADRGGDLRTRLTGKLTSILGDVKSPELLNERMPGVAVQCSAELRSALTDAALPAPSQQQVAELEAQVSELATPANQLRTLLEKRVLQLLGRIVESSSATPLPAAVAAESLQVPAGLSCCAGELTQLGGQLVRLVRHNRAVYGDVYTGIVESLLRTPASTDHTAADTAASGTGKTDPS